MPGQTIADTFVGSGTTLLAARHRALNAIGFDLSPLAVLISNTKVNDYDPNALTGDLEIILNSPEAAIPETPERLKRAYTEQELQEIHNLLASIKSLSRHTLPFFTVALVWTARTFSRAVCDGGWLRWRKWPDKSNKIKECFAANATTMIHDVRELNWPRPTTPAKAYLADARQLPLRSESVDAILTSPPYPNRHDYSRIFHIDLLLMGLREEEIFRLRKRSLRSHVEAARPPAPLLPFDDSVPPKLDHLQSALTAIPTSADRRLLPLLKGYFSDIYQSLQETHRILKPGGRAAFVLGNVRHAGVMIPVDSIVAEMAEHASLIFEEAWLLRFRGNSAQQMGRFGRTPARETVIFLSKPCQT